MNRIGIVAQAFFSILLIGLSSVVQADVRWFESRRHFCPELCDKTAEHKFAVPGGTNPNAEKVRKTPQIYYVCAAAFAGWRIGYNIEYQRDRCYTGFRGSEHYGEGFYLCSDTAMEPLIK